MLLRDIADVKRLKQEDGPNLVTQGRVARECRVTDFDRLTSDPCSLSRRFLTTGVSPRVVVRRAIALRSADEQVDLLVKFALHEGVVNSHPKGIPIQSLRISEQTHCRGGPMCLLRNRGPRLTVKPFGPARVRIRKRANTTTQPSVCFAIYRALAVLFAGMSDGIGATATREMLDRAKD